MDGVVGTILLLGGRVLTASQLVLDSLHEHPTTEATAGACQEREKNGLPIPLRLDGGNEDDDPYGLPLEDKLRRVLLIAVTIVGGLGRRRSIICRELLPSSTCVRCGRVVASRKEMTNDHGRNGESGPSTFELRCSLLAAVLCPVSRVRMPPFLLES
jgi:hypothetical protein